VEVKNQNTTEKKRYCGDRDQLIRTPRPACKCETIGQRGAEKGAGFDWHRRKKQVGSLKHPEKEEKEKPERGGEKTKYAIKDGKEHIRLRAPGVGQALVDSRSRLEETGKLFTYKGKRKSG